MPNQILDLIHAHPVATVVTFAWLVYGVFLWALLSAASEDLPDNIQQGDGDWLWAPRWVPDDEKETA